mgnify:FL=1|jgi:3-hydroxyacyl-[acyl-carrier-protein] dehydratase
MNREELQKILPHRDSMLLVDSAEIRDGLACGEKTISGSEWFLDGHFPDNPVVPGVILCEILAQSTCVLLAGELSGDIETYLTGIEKAKFKAPVRPGDVFKTECSIIKSKEPFYWASGKGFVNGKLCVTAEFSFAAIKR